MSEIGKRIRQIRKDMGFTQARFSAILGITRGHVATLETGKSQPSEHLLLLISEKLSVNIGWLKHGEGPISTLPDLTPEQSATLKRIIQESPFNRLIDKIKMFLRSHEYMADMVLEGFRETKKSDPSYCPPELVDLMKELLSKREDEPFKTAEKALRKYRPYVGHKIPSENDLDEAP